MRVYAPSYYKKFKCIADKCKNNCCIGWDVQIDGDSLEEYRKAKGEFTKSIVENIYIEGNEAYFRMKDDGKCPFLNSCGLCDIISRFGEKSIPYICRMHPRFKNVFSGREEIGLGMCCEEAARIMLTDDNALEIVPLTDEEETLTSYEEELILRRERIFRILGDREEKILDKLHTLAEMYSLRYDDFSEVGSLEVFDELEYMSRELPDLISEAGSDERTSFYIPLELEHPLSRLAEYFAFRLISPSADGAEERVRIGAVLLYMSCILRIICARGLESEFSMGSLISLARLFSAEIEYSPDNTETLLSEVDILINF